MLAATGERASSALLAIALQSRGTGAVSYAGWQWYGDNSAYTKARIESIDDKRIGPIWAQAKSSSSLVFRAWTRKGISPRWGMGQ